MNSEIKMRAGYRLLMPVMKEAHHRVCGMINVEAGIHAKDMRRKP